MAFAIVDAFSVGEKTLSIPSAIAEAGGVFTPISLKAKGEPAIGNNAFAIFVPSSWTWESDCSLYKFAKQRDVCIFKCLESDTLVSSGLPGARLRTLKFNRAGQFVPTRADDTTVLHAVARCQREFADAASLRDTVRLLKAVMGNQKLTADEITAKITGVKPEVGSRKIEVFNINIPNNTNVPDFLAGEEGLTIPGARVRQHETEPVDLLISFTTVKLDDKEIPRVDVPDGGLGITVVGLVRGSSVSDHNLLVNKVNAYNDPTLVAVKLPFKKSELARLVSSVLEGLGGRPALPNVPQPTTLRGCLVDVAELTGPAHLNVQLATIR